MFVVLECTYGRRQHASLHVGLCPGDRRRVFVDTVVAMDIDDAARVGTDDAAMRARFGSGAAWFLAGVVQEDLVSQVGSALEAEL